MASHWQWTPRLTRYLAEVYQTKPPLIPDGFVFRRAVHKDQEHVARLTEILHSQTDSMPARYQHYLNDKRRVMVVAEDVNTKSLVGVIKPIL